MSAAANILLAEDDTIIRDLVTRVLKDAGHNVVAAAEPRAAFDRFMSHTEKFDLLVADVVMPHMSGPALARLIHKNQPDLPVIYMTGYQDRAVLEEEAGAFDGPVIQKPFTVEDLIGAVRTALAGPAADAPDAS